MVTQSNNLNLTPGQISPRVNVSQYDKKSRTLTFSLFNGSQPLNIASGMAVTIEGTKPDNTGFQYAMTTTIGSNVVSMSIEQQMTVLAGEVPCEIVVSSTGKRLASANFILVVEPAALNEDTIISETELPLIEEAAELAENIAIYVATIDADAAKAEGYAVGKQNGTDVPSTSPYYHNNAKYYKEQAATSASTASTKASNAATSASNAATSATNAANSASTASTAALTATTKASDASTAAQTATTKASEASASAQAAQQAAASLTVDSATSTTSTNPVQNKVITSAVNSLKETFTNNGAHNLLPMTLANIKAANTAGTWSGNTYTKTTSTITFTSSDGVSVDKISCVHSGSSSGNTLELPFRLKAGTYILSSGFNEAYGSVDTFVTKDNVVIARGNSTSPGSQFTLAEDSDLIWAFRNNASAANSFDFYPMLRLASDTDTTFTPYAKTNQELTKETAGLIDNVNKNGAKNLLPLTAIKSQVYNGVTITVNADGSITLNGTYTGNSIAYLTLGSTSLPDGEYNFYVTGLSSGGHWINATKTDGTSEQSLAHNPLVADSSKYRSYNFGFSIWVGATYDNITFYPMVQLASNPDNTYVPYAISNRKITDTNKWEEYDLTAGKMANYALYFDFENATTKKFLINRFTRECMVLVNGLPVIANYPTSAGKSIICIPTIPNLNYRPKYTVRGAGNCTMQGATYVMGSEYNECFMTTEAQIPSGSKIGFTIQWAY